MNGYIFRNFVREEMHGLSSQKKEMHELGNYSSKWERIVAAKWSVGEAGIKLGDFAEKMVSISVGREGRHWGCAQARFASDRIIR
jgi:hypothetical protein